MRDVLIQGGILPEAATGDDLRQFLVQASADFRDKAPVSAAQAATIILDGVRAGSWRILIGEDARMIDAAVRAKPEAAYDYAELFAGLVPDGASEATRPAERLNLGAPIGNDTDVPSCCPERVRDSHAAMASSQRLCDFQKLSILGSD